MQPVRATDSDTDRELDAETAVSTADRSIPLEPETIDRLEAIREEGQSYDELVTELVDIYESTEWSLAHAGDAI